VNAEEVMMFPLKKILCPVDFSEPSFEGLKVAKELAQTYSAELILINVVQPVQAVAAPGVPAIYSVKELAEAARKSFEEVVENRVPKGVTVRTKVVEGQPADEIVREAQAENADIIVTATHGWTGWRRYIFGSVAEKVVRLSTCPVLTVPGPSGENQ
jgi:nucleotide-binding universal stress UspA family protein